MRTWIYSIILIVLLVGCRKEESNQREEPENNDTAIEPPKSAVQVKSQKPAISRKIDSIDKSNTESIEKSGNNITLAYVYSKDSSIILVANIRADYRIFGYAKPSVKSEKLLLLSIYRSDVEGNPFRCKLGAYYETSGMKNLDLKYKETSGDFIKAVVVDNRKKKTLVYFEKKWIEFE